MTLDMHTRIRPADWCATPELAGGEKASLAGLAVGPELSPRKDVFTDVKS